MLFFFVRLNLIKRLFDFNLCLLTCILLQTDTTLWKVSIWTDPEDAIAERLDNKFNQDINLALMKLLAKMIRHQNEFVQGFMIRENEEEARKYGTQVHAVTEGIEPHRIRLLITVPEGADNRRYNVPVLTKYETF